MPTVFSGYMALGSGLAGAFAEVSNIGYSRQPVVLAGGSSTTAAILSDAFFGPVLQVSASPQWTFSQQATRTDGVGAIRFPVVTQIALYDAATGGNILCYWQLATPRIMNLGDTMQIGRGLTVLTIPTLATATSFAPGASIGTTNLGETIVAGNGATLSGGIVITA